MFFTYAGKRVFQFLIFARKRAPTVEIALSAPTLIMRLPKGAAGASGLMAEVFLTDTELLHRRIR
jgi:hypothetical protein